jgi:hypothetical protein
MVDSVLGAMHRADAAEQAKGAWCSPAAIYDHRPHIYPTPVYEPRPHRHPTPVYASRPVIHPHPRVEQLNLSCPLAPTPPPKASEPFIQAPWKVLPWENTVQPRQTVKIHLIHTDVVHKGTVLDLFV